eukprot:TRINITY_DN1156_c0_g1_i1.p1 TRINITY_DN1156_c0_g1~~TRINITY_DN1156_c0_g1_i1.p1  ORF type:complete len:533 (-),score=118.29 TRINITY_DN1156_c0_g1_i1:52-1602(-)
MTTAASFKDGPVNCTWHLNTKEKSPHTHEKMDPIPPKICNSILDHIGRTPLVRINKVTKSLGIKCEILAKCEFFNAGGSVKDRIGKRMVEDAEKSGRIKPGDTLIEPTSGNTGIGLALAAAIKGYKMIITLPEKMSTEKVDVLKALGASIIRTPTEAAWDSPESHIGVAKRINQEITNSHILDQYKNPSNPLAHYDTTAEELIYQTDGKIDYIVISAGTGGTVTGLARKLKEKIPNIQIVGVDPEGSILAQPDNLNSGIYSYKVEGIGYDFIPTVLERSLVDKWVKSNDIESFKIARRLIKEEGLLCGGSSGSAMAAAIKVAKDLPEGKRVVVILPDSVRNYMSKFLSDDWMIDNGFLEHKPEDAKDQLWWSGKTVSDLSLAVPVTISSKLSVQEAIDIMKSQGFDQLPVVDDFNNVLGMVTEGNLMSQIVQKRIKTNDLCNNTNVLYKKFREVSNKTTLSELSRIFDKEPFALVITTQKYFSSDTQVQVKKIVEGVATRIDLLNYIAEQSKHNAQ